MGFFGDIDVNEISTGPKAGTYPAEITKVEMKRSKKGEGDNYVVITYTVADPSYEFPVDEWLRFPDANEMRNRASWDDSVPLNDKGHTEKYQLNQALSRFKKRLISIGVPESRVGSIGPDELVGAPVFVTTSVNDQGFASIRSVSTQSANAGAPVQATPVVSANPVAAASPLAAVNAQSTPAAPAAPPAGFPSPFGG